MRLVFDTNVYVSTFVVPGSRSDRAFRLAGRGVFEPFVSEEILAELKEKLGSKFGFSAMELEAAERTVRDVAAIVEPEVGLSVLADESDNRILECAVASGAAAIITGDRDLLALKSYEGIGIMTVAELLYSFPEL